MDEEAKRVLERARRRKKQTAFDQLSWHGLIFLLERTDYSEPWLGFGFATQMAEEMVKALKRKEEWKDKTNRDIAKSRIGKNNLFTESD